MKATGATLEGFTGRHRDIARYLATEVVAGLDDDLRAFLLRTSVLPRLCAGLCDHVLETSGSAQLLERVAQENLFLVALDEEGEWFRYQALFAEYARAQLDAAHPGAATGLHRRAAVWFRERGEIEDAIEQYAAGGDPETIAELIELHHLTLARAGRAATIERWIDALPRDLLTARPGVLTAGMLAAGGSALPRDEVAAAARARRPRARGRPGALDAVPRDDPAAAARALRRRRRRRGDGVRPRRARERARRRRRARGRRDVDARVRAAAHRLAGGATSSRARRSCIRAPRSAPTGSSERSARARWPRRSTAARTWPRRSPSGRGTRPSTRASRTASRRRSRSFALALVALRDGRPIEAERALRRALKLRPAIEYGALHAWLTVTLAEISAARGRLGAGRARAGRGTRAARGLRRPGLRGHATPTPRSSGCATCARARPHRSSALSKSEIAVLRLFDAERSAREIGAELYLSHNTVKTHIRAIYRKLGVGTREDALARGEALGLLEEAG